MRRTLAHSGSLGLRIWAIVQEQLPGDPGVKFPRAPLQSPQASTSTENPHCSILVRLDLPLARFFGTPLLPHWQRLQAAAPCRAQRKLQLSLYVILGWTTADSWIPYSDSRLLSRGCFKLCFSPAAMGAVTQNEVGHEGDSWGLEKKSKLALMQVAILTVCRWILIVVTRANVSGEVAQT